ncbi:MAG TPA: MmgE/PrpD family protein [Syntrophales bacterium]|nr:MmgE/PrpD family protein [Syntrophales bacterium]
MKIEQQLADYIIGLQYEDLPEGVVKATKAQILNILSVALGGSGASGMRELVGLLKEWGGKPESTVFAFGGKLPALHAAQANAAMAHAWDFDDTYNKIMLHSAVVTVLPALAVAETKSAVSGKEFIATVAASVDFGCRMCLVLTAPPGEKEQLAWHYWHFTALFGYFMSAAAAGRILGLDQEKMLNALGLAYHQAAGNTQCLREGAQAKRLGPGFASRAGVASAMMAQRGNTGAKSFIEGEVGFYGLYHPQSPYCDLTKLTNNLGMQFENEDISLKPYSCGVVNHTAIDAALAIVRKHDIRPEDVDAITVFTGEGSYFLCSPIETKRHPKNAVGTQFSIPWSVATAVAKKRASVRDYTDEAARDPVLHRLTDKIVVELDPALTGGSIEPTRIKIKTMDGREFVQQVDIPLGSPKNPFTPADARRKLLDCNSVSVNSMPEEKLDRLIATVGRLEELEVIQQLVPLLV